MADKLIARAETEEYILELWEIGNEEFTC